MQLLHNIGIRFFALLSTKSSIQNLTILLIAALICFPCFFRGIPGGYDSRTHVNYQNQFSRQFWSGDIYPRWLAEANKGYGSPIFVIQYPLPYFLTALIRAAKLESLASLYFLFSHHRELPCGFGW
jgi:hypothetical protein